MPENAIELQKWVLRAGWKLDFAKWNGRYLDRLIKYTPI